MKGSAARVISEPKVETVCALHSLRKSAFLTRLGSEIAAKPAYEAATGKRKTKVEPFPGRLDCNCSDPLICSARPRLR